MNSNSPITLDALDEQGRGIRLSFEWRGDRYGHTVYGVSDGQAEPIALSVEERGDDDWPLSPPVQEIREFDELDGERQLMLIGAAAGAHWSMTVRAAAMENDRYLEFDAAVRVQKLPTSLSIALDATEAAEWIDLPSGLVACHRDPYLLFVAPAVNCSDADTPTLPYEFRTTAPQDEAKRRILQPQIAIPRTFPHTIRWRYCMGL